MMLKMVFGAMGRQAFKFQLGPLRNCKLFSIYEPDYLELMKPKIPVHETLNIQLKGYDFSILESYQKYVHKIAKNMDVNVEDCWAVPATELKVTKLKPQSSIVDCEYKLKIYERNVQISEVPSTTLVTLVRVLEATLPEGVTMNIHPHEDEHEEIRYVPDKELLELKTQLEEMSAPKKK